jgi:hypothetical protein
MDNAPAELRNLTAQLDAISHELQLVANPEHRQALLKQFRIVLEHVDELLSREFNGKSASTLENQAPN